MRIFFSLPFRSAGFSVSTDFRVRCEASYDVDHVNSKQTARHTQVHLGLFYAISVALRKQKYSLFGVGYAEARPYPESMDTKTATRRFWTIEQVADLLGVHRNTVLALLRDRELAYVRVRRRVAISDEALQTSLREHEVPAIAATALAS